MNTGINRLIEAYITQDNLADALSGATNEVVHQSKISRWLNEELDVSADWFAPLIEVGRAQGIEVSISELRPDLAKLFPSD